jgi:hypothetical protein
MNSKCSAFAGLTFYFDDTAMSFDNAVANRQTQPQAPPFIGGNERLENPSQHIGVNAGAAVSDGQQNHTGAFFDRANSQAAAARHGIDRV